MWRFVIVLLFVLLCLFYVACVVLSFIGVLCAFCLLLCCWFVRVVMPDCVCSCVVFRCCWCCFVRWRCCVLLFLLYCVLVLCIALGCSVLFVMFEPTGKLLVVLFVCCF